MLRASRKGKWTPVPAQQVALSRSHEAIPDVCVPIAMLARPETLPPFHEEPRSEDVFFRDS